MFHEPLSNMENIAMVESNRMFQRKKVSIPVTVTPDNLPLVASHTEVLPMTPIGTIFRESYGASMKNTSVDGFCFVTGKKMEPGTEIEVKMVNFNPIPMGEKKLTECQAKVVWCNTIPQTGAGKCYEMGARRSRRENLPILNLKSHHFASIKCM